MCFNPYCQYNIRCPYHRVRDHRRTGLFRRYGVGTRYKEEPRAFYCFLGGITMKIKPFEVEEWMNAYETGARYNIAETCVNSVSLDELFNITGVDKAAFLN